MRKLELLFAIASAIYLLSHHTTNAKKLTAELCSAKLITARAHMASLYDGDDTIYLFGGGGGCCTNKNLNFKESLKYSISKDTIELAGLFPSASFGGAVVMNKFQNIFIFYGRESGDPIHQYFPATQSFVNVSSFEDFAVGDVEIKPDMDTAIIFGGSTNRIIFVTSLNLNTLESERIGNYTPEFSALSKAAIWMEGYDLAYIFTEEDILKYYRTNNNFVSLGKQLPMRYSRDAVTDGKYIYLFGELRNGTGLILFDPETEEILNMDVGNKPQMSDSAIVYVEKLNRIYIFGGLAGFEHSDVLDDIYYISLDPMNEIPTTTTEDPPMSTIDPDIFNCMGRPDAVYPFPGDCAKFVICREDHGYPFDCPEPLLFHPINRQCTWPDWVDCSEVPQM